ncbi:hypothetical protein [Micromonospora sp. NPDC093277]|uniref:hypothetical protein n=1 Tax=Micromonospora sp. NPDC093277 TaxID=3364291 RepID=UPI0037F10FE1
MGYVFNVATDRDCRRRGYSRACMLALLGWYQQRGGYESGFTGFPRWRAALPDVGLCVDTFSDDASGATALLCYLSLRVVGRVSQR